MGEGELWWCAEGGREGEEAARGVVEHTAQRNAYHNAAALRSSRKVARSAVFTTSFYCHNTVLHTISLQYMTEVP